MLFLAGPSLVATTGTGMSMLDDDAPVLEGLVQHYDLLQPVEPFVLSEQGLNNATRGLRTGAGELIWKTYATQRSAGTARKATSHSSRPNTNPTTAGTP